MTEQYAPPPKPCYWQISIDLFMVKGTGFRQWSVCKVGPCKTAFDAWKLAKLEGGFGDYNYEPIAER